MHWASLPLMGLWFSERNHAEIALVYEVTSNVIISSSWVSVFLDAMKPNQRVVAPSHRSRPVFSCLTN